MCYYLFGMNKAEPTTNALLLNQALNAVGIETILEHFDGRKHVDIYIPKGKIYIEIDGAHHYTSAYQLATDFARDHHSDDDGFHTLRLANEVVEKQAIKIARALKKVLNF
jgi:very-short-patch-repair endonuclease